MVPGLVLCRDNFCCCTWELRSCTVFFCTMKYFELLVPPITVCGSSLARLSKCWIANTLILAVYCRAGVSKLGSSCCPSSLCRAWLSAERPCQDDILSRHVLTHLWPGLVKAFAAQFSGAEASQAIFYCFNPSVSWWLVCRVLCTYTSKDSPSCWPCLNREMGSFYQFTQSFLARQRGP